MPAGGSTAVKVAENATAGPTTQTGLLVLYDDAVKRDAQAVRVTGESAAP